MTDTPPQFVPYVPGPSQESEPTSWMPGAVPPQNPVGTPRPRKNPLMAAVVGLGVLVVALAVAVVVFATRDADEPAAPAATASATPSYSPQAPYSPPPPTDVSVAFGETLRLTDSAGGEIHYVVTADKTYAKTKYGTKPDKGVLYGVKVSVEVISGSTYVCACDYALIAQDGTAYEGSGFQVDGGLDALDVNRGQKASGIVVFDIPQGAQVGGRIELREGGRSTGNQGFWMIP